MNPFQHPLWGYQILLPEGWQHKNLVDRDGFAVDLRSFDGDYQGQNLAQLLIHGEWNGLRKPVPELWQNHLAKVSLMLGAKNLKYATWEMGGAKGYEVEVILPKKSPQRLWTGILENGMLVLSFLALHWKENWGEIEPVLSEIIASLKYLAAVDDLSENELGLPLPPEAEPTDPCSIVSDITDPENWLAYHTRAHQGALQAFYLRELPYRNWEISRYVPYPNPGELPFARIITHNNRHSFSLGIMPGGEEGQGASIIQKTLPK